jgi:hypothetical protein
MATASAGLGWPNYSDSIGVTFSGGNWSSTLPRTNVANARVAVVARTTGVTTGDTVLRVDLGASRTIGVVALIRHNLTADATIRVRSFSDAFTTTVYDSGVLNAFDVQWPEHLLPAGHPNAASRRLTTTQLRQLRWDANHVPATAQTARYWEIAVSDTTNPDGYVEIGRLWMSPLYQPSINMRYGAQAGLESGAAVGRALSGTKYVESRAVARTRQVEFGDLPPEEGQAVLGDLVRVLDLGGQVYWFDDPTETWNRQRTSFLAQLVELPPVVRASFRQSSVAIQLEEVR